MEGSSESRVRVSGMVRPEWGDVERSFSHVGRNIGCVGVAWRLLFEREMRIREVLGYLGRRAESWERKCVPTPPTPRDG